MKIRQLLVAAVMAVAASAGWATPAHAWDELGHRVIARIAWDHMTPAARARAIELLRAAPEQSGLHLLLPRDGRPLAEREREWFVNAAVWSDLIRDRDHVGSVYAHSDWHYVNWFWEQRPDGSAVDREDLGTAGELVTQLQRMTSALDAAAVPDSAKAIDLAWTLHMVGDVHQPLHNSARVTAQDPEGDRGGNSFRLAGLYPFNNLHGYWDALVGPAFPWMPGVRTEDDYVARIAAEIAADWPERRVRVRPGEVREWSREGLRVAQNTAFPRWLIRNEPAPRRYRAHAWEAAEVRVALAGYRLADLLNRTLGD